MTLNGLGSIYLLALFIMTVEQLIEELKKHDPQKLVVVSGYEGGRESDFRVTQTKLRMNANTESYYGPHEPDDEHGETNAIWIG